MTGDAATFELDHRARTLIPLALAGIGAALGWAFPAIASRLHELPWFPMAGPVSLLERVASAGGLVAMIAIGAIAGVLGGLLVVSHAPRLSISEREIIVRAGDARHRFARSQVVEVAIEDERLVLRDDADVELFRSEFHGAPAEILGAAESRGWKVKA
ncbi:hypothetical protein GGQ54_002227 [Naumannella cuiyingiana]|uniref:YqeB PH domain-containing protein n=1 Tax=Naumannella cuiyingiana TaxID=1347891 RepID=A0A7Z0DAA5_9ACTN|nr:hypothetical protein [Naumannella cuiyingiana]NYI71667.1 hypothetical protein [Naumannella cuiyingiana]